MQLSVGDRRIRYAAFVLLALLINLVDSAMARAIADPAKRLLVSAAATADMVVVVSAIYYWLLIRPGIRGRGSLIPIALAGIFHATSLFSDARAVTAAVAGLCEIGLIAYVVVQVRRRVGRNPQRGDTDPIDAMRASLESMFSSAFARVLAAELGIFYYALFSWGAAPGVPADARAFTLYKRSGHADLLYAMAMASVMEIVPVHLLLRHWSSAWAWIATGVSVYAMIWLIGLARSITLRPVLVGPDFVEVRFGLAFRLHIELGEIANVRHAEPRDAESAVVVPHRSAPNVCIELARTLKAEGPFGIRRRVTLLALAADEGGGLLSALQALRFSTPK